MKKKLFLLIAGLASAIALTACGGGGGDTALAASSDATLAVNPTSGPAVTTSLISENFAFPAGVPEFGTNSATTVTFMPRSAAQPDATVPAGNPAFTIASGANTASGVVEFGSCKFKVQTTTFTSGPLSVVGGTITISPCEVALDIGGTPADGVARDRTVTLTLNTATSAPVTVTVSISTSGAITVNNTKDVGTATVAPVTGL